MAENQSSNRGSRPAPSALPAEFAAFIEERMAFYGVPGVVVGVHHEGAEQIAAFGVTSVDTRVPVDAGTLFQIGSTSKTFCGTAAMRLVEQGKLDLDAPIRTYLPDLKLADESVAARVTVRHCLTHVGGWVGDWFDNPSDGPDALALAVARMVAVPQSTPLGAIFSYNNAGFYLAGRVIEVLTGMPYEDAIATLVTGPLGLTRTMFFARNAITERFAVGHLVTEPGTAQVARPWELPRAVNAAGGIIADVADQLAYARFHMGDGTAPDGTRLLSEAGLKAMQQPLVSRGRDGDVGVTWHLETVGGVRVVRHGGATNGQLSAFKMAPERQFATAVLTNANRGVELHGDVTKWAFAHYLGARDVEPVAAPMPAAALAEYVGTYAAALGSVTLTQDGDHLVLQYQPHGGFPRPDTPAPPVPPPTRVEFIGTTGYALPTSPLSATGASSSAIRTVPLAGCAGAVAQHGGSNKHGDAGLGRCLQVLTVHSVPLRCTSRQNRIT